MNHYLYSHKTIKVKSLQPILLVLLLLMVIMSSFQCSSRKNKITTAVNNQIEFQLNPPIHITEVNFQNWASGLQEGGSGINIHILASNIDTTIVLDSIYFRGLKAKIVPHKMNFFARLIRPKVKSKYKFPFNLKENECVISYTQAHQSYYYKVYNLIEKQAQYYPKPPKDN